MVVSAAGRVVASEIMLLFIPDKQHYIWGFVRVLRRARSVLKGFQDIFVTTGSFYSHRHKNPRTPGVVDLPF